MRVHAIQTGEVQIKSRHVESRFGPRPARVADVLADRTWAPQLQALSPDPGAVRQVVMRHMHGDHAGGLAHFPARRA